METAGKDLCESHLEPLTYFCRNDQVRICLVCKNSESHKAHVTMTVEAAALEVKFKRLDSIMHVMKQRHDARNYMITSRSEFDWLMHSTAHPNLVLSEDCKAVKWVSQSKEVPDNPQRFDLSCCVLGCVRYKCDKFYWDVDVGTEGDWAIGVAKESVVHKGEIVLSSKNGIYAIGMRKDQYCSFGELDNPWYTFPRNPFPRNPLRPIRIRVTLDYLGGGVAFTDINNGKVLLELRELSFHKKRLCSFFWLGKDAQLRIYSEDLT
uniref:Uncharacterized protein n=1 Tax=Sphaerodactylus townsendi TaxID=933632 RepID=A0ACB8ECU5_9SAUR